MTSKKLQRREDAALRIFHSVVDSEVEDAVRRCLVQLRRHVVLVLERWARLVRAARTARVAVGSHFCSSRLSPRFNSRRHDTNTNSR